MKYGTPHRVQAQLLFLALGAGFLLGLLYAVLMLLRALLRHSDAAVAAEDIAFCVAAAFGTFLFLLDANGGTVRLYLLLSETAGFWTVRMAASKITAKIMIKKQKKRLQEEGPIVYNGKKKMKTGRKRSEC